MQIWRQVRSWKLTRRDTLIACVLVVLLFIGLTQVDYGCDWTGFGICQFPNGLENGYRPEKTLWDWLGLLIVPAVLALGALYFNRAERQNESRIAEQRAQDALLQTYLDQMTELLLVGKLRKSEPGDEVRHVAQVRTLIALRRLDQERRTILMQFLWASQLIGLDEEQMIVDFREVDLSNADLSSTPISAINLQGANLVGANLTRSDLTGANLSGIMLGEGNLVDTILQRANLVEADLTRANLAGADLLLANLEGATLTAANLKEAILRRSNFVSAELIHANLEGSYLIQADLRDADLAGANLKNAILRGADLTDANLIGANLAGANLVDAMVTQEQLDSATSLEGVTMRRSDVSY